MPPKVFEFKPVTRITTDAEGPPGERVFYLQARMDDELITLIVEKSQVQSLAIGVHKFLEDLAKAKPDLPQASAVSSVPFCPFFSLAARRLNLRRSTSCIMA